MIPRPIAKILILTHNNSLGQQWTNELGMHHDCQVWCGQEKIPKAFLPEVVLLESNYPVGGLVDATPEMGGLPDGLEIGFLRVGGSGSADVRLPVDASSREIHLACTLLAEVVRLRRQVRSGSEVHRHLSRQALTDSLTGLPNRRAWEATFAARLAAAAESPTPLCLAVLDIDHFKHINDHYGHAVGDEVLRCAARAFRESLRHEDFIARLGGDEFGLLLWLPDQFAEPSAKVAAVERARNSIMRSLSQSAELPTGLVISASAGYHVVPVDSPLPCPADLMAAADTALRKAKQLGRNQTAGG